MDIERLPNEGYVEYAHRLTDAVNDGIMNWQEWSDAIVGYGAYSGETCVKNGRFFKKFLEKCDSEHENSLEKMQFERKKIQDSVRELNEERRAKARNELITERIEAAISRLPKIEVQRHVAKNDPCIEQTALLLFSDVHAGSTYEIRGLHGEIINAYDWDIMKQRMEQILYNMEYAISHDGMEFDNIIVGGLGDWVEGILRESSLVKLREPVIDTIIRFSEYYAQWLANLYEICGCPMKVVTIGGNHDVARMLTSKPQFDGENFGKLIREFIAIRLKDIDGIVIKPYAEFDVEDICGSSVGFAHGTDKDLANAMDYFSNLYDIDVDELYAGHYHGNSQTTNGVSVLSDRLCTRIGSICGLDTFSHKIRKASKPGYYFAIYSAFYGKTWERKYYLN